MTVHSAPILLWIADASQRCVFFNPSWLAFTGRTMAQERGFGWAAGIHPDDYDRCIEIAAAAFATHKPFERDYRLRRADGVYRLMHDAGEPRFTNGSPSQFEGYVGTCC